jgi:type III secretory pathway component EscS
MSYRILSVCFGAVCVHLLVAVCIVAVAPTAAAKLREFARIAVRLAVPLVAQAVVTIWLTSAPPEGVDFGRWIVLSLGFAFVHLAALAGRVVPLLRALADLASALRLDLAVRQQTVPGAR